VAAAVVLGDVRIAGLADSKALGGAARERLHEEIVASAHAVGVGMATVEEIDALNIHHATLLAMRRAVEALTHVPGAALIDGRFCPPLSCPAQALVGGDATEPAISAASIVAKVRRDRIMVELHERFPVYGFDRHKGYPTPAHLRALSDWGACVEHRRSFRPVRDLLTAAAP
jgi:ribonuclease HII